MTAAVARPPLFSHLVASRPDRDRGSIPATIVSVLLHAVVIAAVLMLSARVVSTPISATIIRIALPDPISPPADAAPASGGGGGSFSVEVPSPVIPTVPNFIPTDIPKPGANLGIDPEKLFSVLPPAPGAGPGPAMGNPAAAGEPGFTPYTQAPRLLNRAEVSQIMERNYPRRLVDLGIGGTVVVWLRVDVTGKVVETRISKPSEHEALDLAALRVGEAMRFSPAFNRDQPVQVWVEIPIIFTTR